MKASARTALAVLAVTTAAGLLSTSALAETPWQADHQARTHINERIKHQEERITQAVRQGRVTHQQAQALRREDRRIAQEERDMAAQNLGGHLRPDEVAALNQQLDANSHAIGM